MPLYIKEMTLHHFILQQGHYATLYKRNDATPLYIKKMMYNKNEATPFYNTRFWQWVLIFYFIAFQVSPSFWIKVIRSLETRLLGCQINLFGDSRVAKWNGDDGVSRSCRRIPGQGSRIWKKEEKFEPRFFQVTLQIFGKDLLQRLQEEMFWGGLTSQRCLLSQQLLQVQGLLKLTFTRRVLHKR